MSKYDSYIGRLLNDRYRLNKFVGVGGMAMVFEAFDTLENRIVAIKLLREEIASDMTSVKRFINESKAVAMLDHPNIVKIYDVEVRGEHKYIVMDLVEGITLRSYMDSKGALPFKAAITITEQIILALEHAHSKGIIHRDIKPQNIMLQKSGKVTVTDFGIAKLPNAETVSMADKAIGTVFYISPEQAGGKEIDARSDLYSLGILMYEMNTGKLPFNGETPVSVALMQINDTPRPPHEVLPSIPRGLEQIILKAIEKDPAARIQSAEEMLGYLKKVSADPFTVFDFGVPANATAKQTPAEVEEEEEEYIQPKKSLRKRIFGDRRSKATMTPIILAVFLAALIVGSISAIYLIFNVFDPLLDIFRPTEDVGIRVIDFRGEEANSLNIENWNHQGFEVRVLREPNGYFPSGEVFRQDPMPGVTRRHGYTVTLTVSTGPDMARMGNYIMEDHRIAQTNLQARGFDVVIEHVNNNAIPNGLIVSTKPAPGQPIAAFGNQITLQVSRGPTIQNTNVPNLENMTRAQAEAAIRAANLRVGTVTTEPRAVEGVPPGTVSFQSHAANASVARNTVINIRINTGTPLAVPNVVGQTREEATAAITEANLVVGTVTYDYSDTVEPGLVIRQTPAGGAPHVAESSVDLVIARARPGVEPPPPPPPPGNDNDDNDNDPIDDNDVDNDNDNDND
ncbi:MAG: Stk1 family PASTA domain-containing Ser/Thr kinase [Oscillospiraceae bacterium]|nr:Stk1 family PASTA domain-containing Ser/Thr kinase [Oscillospiraceae bacterium]